MATHHLVRELDKAWKNLAQDYAKVGDLLHQLATSPELLQLENLLASGKGASASSATVTAAPKEGGKKRKDAPDTAAAAVAATTSEAAAAAAVVR